jgi:Flp pilus assembly CpaE family ATPase
MLVKHDSGLHVLAAPGKFPHFEPTKGSIEVLLSVACGEFDNVVVDVGSRLDVSGTSLHHDASRIYLVTQAGIPELRNANRLISQAFSGSESKLEIVLNRYQSKLGIPEENITEALTRPAEWKIHNDHALVRKMQIDAKPLVFQDNPISRTIREMARSVIGSSEPEQANPGKKISRFFRFLEG